MKQKRRGLGSGGGGHGGPRRDQPGPRQHRRHVPHRGGRAVAVLTPGARPNFGTGVRKVPFTTKIEKVLPGRVSYRAW